MRKKDGISTWWKIYIGTIFILIVLNGVQDITKFKINETAVILLLALLVPFIVPYLEEFEIFGFGKFKLRERIEKLEEEGETGVDTSIETKDDLSTRVIELEAKLEDSLKKEAKVLRSPQEKENLKKVFARLSSKFTEETRKREMSLRERALIVNTLEQVGSKIDDFNFLIDKLRNGNEGERVGAAASLKILRKKEAFNDLLSTVSYTGKGGYYVRYRVAEALNALLRANKLEPEEIEKLKGVLNKQYSKEKNRVVSEYIDKVLATIRYYLGTSSSL
jgi:hypothetical protein